MGKWIRDNGLAIVLLSLFAVSVLGHFLTGLAVENEERLKAGLVSLDALAYAGSGAFLSSVFENWESEFLQMWAYVMLTAYLYQRGSPESRDPDGGETRSGERAGDIRTARRWFYAHSLGLALLGLFVLSFVLHWLNSARHAAEEALEHGLAPPLLFAYLSDAQLWFESFQNWQSEFLSTAMLAVLGIFLRERQSPESKAVGDPDSKTGTA